MIINGFCSIVPSEGLGAHLKQAFLDKSSVYCALIIAQHFQRKIHKEEKKCAGRREDEIVHNVKVSLGKQPQY